MARTKVDEARLSTRTWVLALAGIVGLALLLRVPAFGRVPPGLYHDEAYNGLDALAVLRGARPLWFPANNGREPFYIYLVALSVAALGPTVVAVRAPALLLGLATVPATAFLGASLFSRRVGLLAAAAVAVTFWPVHLSRVGYRAVALPLLLALALGFLWRGLSGGRGRDYAAAGACYGASFYTYLAARFTPLGLALLGGLALWPAARLPRPGRRGLLLFAGAALVVLAPLLGYVALHPDVVTARAAQVSVFNPAISGGDPWATLGRHALKALGAFLVQGDRIPRHNLPWRPVFDVGLGLAFLAGVGVALLRRGAGWYALLWVATMLAPTILAEDAPHFLRGVGVLPMVFVLPALGLDALWRRLASRRRAAWGAAAAGLVVAGSLASTAGDYFGRYASSSAVYYHFEGGSQELATRINRFLAASTGDRRRVAYVSEQLWQTWPSLRFLAAEGDTLRVLRASTPAADPAAREALVALWPFEPQAPGLACLPAGSTIRVSQDLYEQGDLEPAPRPLARIYQATAEAAPGPTLAVFDQGIRLAEARLERAGERRLRATLVWEASQPLQVSHTVFVHARRGGTMLGQHDGLPASGALPTTLWRVGDRVVDVHDLELEAPYDAKTDQIIVGLYDLATMTRLRIVDSISSGPADAVVLPVP